MAKNDSDIDRLRARIASNRDKLSANVEGLVSEVHPTALKRHAVAAVKQRIEDGKEKVKATVVDEGGPRWDRIGTGVLAAVGVVLVVVSIRGIGRAVGSRVARG
ncbi:Protein of unknown function [Propionibacterium cyclohexanicum]|uniref:DUF3618 domain-containing protein n=1 Tax=Propionibacterium cyclohexanicum TaxID=64702 RepID=A0A1H9QBX7_9ACTN|nr:Protein of unknown function [Propionibacterium cyclohexanicum]